MTTEALLLEVLDAVESREMRLLAWGIVDAALSRDEVDALIDPLLDRAIETGSTECSSAAHVVEGMRARRLLHETPDGRWRSRLAEGVRLLQRLRQTFPDSKVGPYGDWESSPTLVADYRIARRPRRYPKRDQALQEFPWWTAEADPTVRAALEALATRDGEPISLSAFQCRATARILDILKNRRDAGTVVSSGTGSGKTLAFYLPVLSRVASTVVADSERWVRAVALYPRNELLKDQLAEVYERCRLLDPVQLGRGARKLTVGAYFGPAPFDGTNQSMQRAKWQRLGDGYICGYARCPRGCATPMVWRDADRLASRERLTCAGCNTAILEDELILTRQRLQREPPDLLFTSTETLNRRLSDSRVRHLFGVECTPSRTPRAVLLDEVHTYSGTHGAQVAYLLRRWRAALRSPIAWVGLSATLTDAKGFFRDLTDLSDSAVVEISPLEAELEDEGAEYVIALRGDPASRTALLSTTIQSAMLLARLQDHRERPVSDGIYAYRTFVFTDDIDVTNRLYFDLLDAEGRDSFGNVDGSRPDGGLAALRAAGSADDRRYRQGQDWRALDEIGHELDKRLEVGRTSSQDAGVDQAADVVVATASLEVGFNDPTVGAVLQHKSPRDIAQFLQRKGRAGRQRETRPWTVVVLSDYGRDRITWQNYQSLFDPILPARYLPVRNRHVLRMQAVYAAIDFLRNKAIKPGSVWTALSGPAQSASTSALQRELAPLLKGLLGDPAEADALESHLASALNVKSDDLEPVLWNYPRPLLLAALPTAWRRLAHDWRGADGPCTDLAEIDHPLPEFVPASLFEELNLPEVAVYTPPQVRGGKEDRFEMPLLQAMRHFTPGRVSRRFGIVHRFVRHWLPIPLDLGATVDLDLDGFGSLFPLGRFAIADRDGAKTIPVFQPRSFRPVVPPVELSDGSNATLDWRTQIVAPAQGVELPRDTGSHLVSRIDACTHHAHTALEVRRFAVGAHARALFKGGREVTVQARFTRNGEHGAIGFSLLVDGTRFRVTVPDELWRSGTLSPEGPQWRALRMARFNHDILKEPLEDIDSDFLRERIGAVFVAAAMHRVARGENGLTDALTHISDDDTLQDILPVIDVMLGSHTQDRLTSGRQARLRAEARDSLARTSIRRALLGHSRRLVSQIDESWEPWLRQVFLDTVAAGIGEAIVDLCPQADASQFVVDTQAGPCDGSAGSPTDVVWVTETGVGGAGVVEQFVVAYAADPKRFDSLLARALEPTEWENNDVQLSRLVRDLQSGMTSPLNDALARYRQAATATDAGTAFHEFREALASRGYWLHRSFVSAMVNRLLRPGSSPQTDRLVAWAMERWESLECGSGIEIDMPTLGILLADSDEAVEAFSEYGPGGPGSAAWRAGQLGSLLWPRGGALRNRASGSWNPYVVQATTERLLVVNRDARGRPVINLLDNDWWPRIDHALGSGAGVTATAPRDRADLVARLCDALAIAVLESDYLWVHARLRAIRITDDRMEIDVDVDVEETLT